MNPTKLRHADIRTFAPLTIRNPQSAIRNSITVLAIACTLAGCGGDSKETQTETDAIAALQKSGARLFDNKERRVNRIDFERQPISDEQLTNAGKCARLEMLLMAGSQIEEAGLAHLAGLKRLRQISLKGSSVTDAGLEHLGQLKTLREVDLEKTKITDAGLEHLSSLSNLEKLYLDGTSTTSTGISKLKAALPHLTVSGP